MFSTGQIYRETDLYRSVCHPDQEQRVNRGDPLPFCRGGRSAGHMARWRLIPPPAPRRDWLCHVSAPHRLVRS